MDGGLSGEAGGGGAVMKKGWLPFYGWVIVALAFIAQMISSMSMQGLSTYVEPLQRQFGWSSAQTAAGRSFQQVDNLLGPLSGWLADRFGARCLMSAGVVIYVGAFVMFSRIETLVGFYVACLLMAVANSLAGLLMVAFVTNHWFRRRRSTAMGLAVLGFAVAGVWFIPAIVWVQGSFGWRNAALATAGLIGVLGLPIMLFMRDTPESKQLLPDGDKPGDPVAAAHPGAAPRQFSFTLNHAVRTRAFWLLTSGNALANAMMSAVMVHQFAFFESVVSRENAALVLMQVNVFNMLGRVIGGMAGDRYPKHALLTLNMAASAAAVLLMELRTATGLFAYAAIFGFTWGTRTAVLNSAYGDYFGRASFGKILGLASTIASPLAFVSPILVGWAVDRSGDYGLAVAFLAAVAMMSSVSFLFAGAPRAAPVESTP
ncbi:MAG: MFS transporter [Rhizobiaceae bacterium]|nr:MFS transporter [Rhizobiaceae bacterium]